MMSHTWGFHKKIHGLGFSNIFGCSVTVYVYIYIERGHIRRSMQGFRFPKLVGRCSGTPILRISYLRIRV